MVNTFIKAIGTYLHNKTFVLHGVEGVLTYQEWEAIYPYKHTVQKIWHTANNSGKLHPTYIMEKAYLLDDYSTDILDSEDNLLMEIVYYFQPNFMLEGTKFTWHVID